MRLFLRLTLAVIILIVTVLLLMPLIIGWVISRNINWVLPFNPEYIDVKVVSASKSWFYSDLKLNIKPQKKLLNYVRASIPDFDFSDFTLVLNAHIQHGPLFYQRHPGSPLMGLAYITRNYQFIDKNNSAFIAKIPILANPSQVIKKDSTLVGFSGRYIDSFKLENISIQAPEVQFDLKSISGSIERRSNDKIKSDIQVRSTKISNGNIVLDVPFIKINADMYQDPLGLWMGQQQLTIPTADIRDRNEAIRISEIQLLADTTENNGLLSGERQLKIKHIKYRNQEAGPLALHIQIQNLNEKALLQLLDAYREVAEKGEMYESQLKQRVFTLFPELITPNTVLELKTFQINTPHGVLAVDAKVFWPKEASLANLASLVQEASVNLNFKIAKPLANKLISFFAKAAYAYHITPDQKEVLIEKENSIKLSNQKITASITQLVEQNSLTKQDGLELLSLVQNKVPLIVYQQKINTLQTENKINLLTAQQLISLYSDFSVQYQELNQALTGQQTLTEQQIQSQISDNVSKGYLLDKNNEYQFMLRREKSILFINGKPMGP